MLTEAPQVTIVAVFAALTLFALIGKRIGIPTPVAIYLPYLWAFACSRRVRATIGRGVVRC